ncbi:Rha family transcriptional regulator [Haemophilus paraphrohaemolyticus]|uniref:Rha family transcriptional regulator n=1 Tax=Haemophilus paraphrohaemolyticus TaxID=736 RepID=UPI00352E6DCC
MKTTELLPITEKNASLTMSSREIAELCEKEHRSVLRDIDNMLSELEIQSAQFCADYIDSRGRSYRCFNLPKDLTLTIIAGYNVKLRKRIIDRWQELENQQKPTALSRKDLALMVIAAEEENERLQLENKQQATHIESMESYFRNGITAPQFAKGLNGVNSQKINDHLQQVKWLYKDGNNDWRVTSYARDRYMTEEPVPISPHGKEPFFTYRPVLLQKGAAKIYKWYTQQKLTMKSNWNGEFTQDKAVGL